MPQQPNIYSQQELKHMQLWQRRKDTWLLPITTILWRNNITPWHVSIGGLMLAALGTLATLATLTPWWFFTGLFLQIILDGVDGALARNHNLRHKLGSVIDIATDYAVILLALVIAASLTTISSNVLAAAGITYGILLAIAYRRSQRAIPYTLLPRGRLLFFLLLTFDVLLTTNILAVALPVWVLVNVWFIAAGMYALLIKK